MFVGGWGDECAYNLYIFLDLGTILFSLLPYTAALSYGCNLFLCVCDFF